ncbi:hypothetical protein DFAR_1150028 [Desulfarculales bacterium]
MEEITASLSIALVHSPPYVPQVRGKIERSFRTVSLAGRLYEAPVPLIGKQIILLYHDHHHDRVEVLLENRSHGLPRPLDLAVNYRVKRDHHLLRLEFSSTTAPTGGSLF